MATDGTARFVPALPRTLLLWDVDHTLIENGGVSKDTYALAFELITGSAPKLRPVTDGRTDFQIMRELLEANSVDVEQYVSISQFEEVLLEAMRRNAKELPKRGYALAGVVEALQALSLSSNVVQSVLTGNIAANAFAKLNAFGLDEWVDLDVGGYGSDDIVRSNLVAIARRKVFEKYGMDFDESSTVLLGDTPLDIKAGHDGRAKVLAVATGSFSVDVLREAGADTVLNDLRDLDVFLKSLIDLRERAVTPR